MNLVKNDFRIKEINAKERVLGGNISKVRKLTQ